MIVEKILDMFFSGVNFLISMLPTPVIATISGFTPPDIVRYGICFFPSDIMFYTVAAFVTWKTIFILWAITEWVYKKIPGIN